MSRPTTFTSEPCDVDNCRSRRYHVASDGRTYCHRGHQVEGEVLTQQEEFSVGGSQVAAKSKKSRKEGEQREKATLKLQGAAAVELYLQCFQLILRKQLKWLMQVKNYPIELEAIAQDLWSLRLEMLKDILEDTDEEKPPQMFSTQTDTEDSDYDTSRSRPPRAVFHKKIPKLIESLALIYLAIVLMRLPICLSDIKSWVLHEDFVFLRALKDIPTSMRQRLPAEMRHRFEPRTGLGHLESLHLTTQALVDVLHRSFGMIIPPINHKLLLFRFISALALPLDVFPAVERLVNLLNLDLLFKTGRRHTRLSEHPELRLMGLLVIATKMLYPADIAVRHPRDHGEPAALVVDWAVWNKRQSVIAVQADEPKSDNHDLYLDLTEHDALTMSEKDMDGYLDWFGRTWADKEEPHGNDADYRNELFRMFPVEASKEAVAAEESDQESTAEVKHRLETLRLNQSSLIIRHPEDDPEEMAEEGEQILRPGQLYNQYRSEEDVPEKAKPFVVTAADLVGLPLKSLLVVVFQLERKLQVWSLEERKKRKLQTQDDRDEDTHLLAMETSHG